MHFCLHFKQNFMHMYCTYMPSKKPCIILTMHDDKHLLRSNTDGYSFKTM
jgi:hypothetical protein